MFASKTIAGHLARGVIAATLIAWALAHQSSDPAIAAIAGLGSLVAMRGCPLCWTAGLFETVVESIRARRISRTVRTTCSSNVCHHHEASHELLHA